MLINEVDKMYLPNGQIQKLDKLQRLLLIATELKKKDDVIFAILGKPSAPVYQPLIDASIQYWNKVDNKRSIQYGEFQGEQTYRIEMAQAISRLYKAKVDKEDVIFTSGGTVGLQAIKYLVQSLSKQKYVVTTSLSYPEYIGISVINDKGYNLLFVDVEREMSAIKAQNLEETLKGINKSQVGCFYFCDPNNPIGKIVGQEEWLKIIPILERYDESIIVLDEAYAEMVFDKPHVSLYTLASQKLRNRIILLRSATKGFSASGQRMAILVTSNKVYSHRLISYHTANLFHAPKGGQYAYTAGMKHFNQSQQLKLASFYKPIVRKVQTFLQLTGFNVKNLNYFPVEATFYVMADMSELFGKKMSEDMLIYYVNKNKKVVQNNVDIGMYLLVKYKLAIMPMFYFSAKLGSGLIRITCSFEQEQELQKLCKVFVKIRQDLSKE